MGLLDRFRKEPAPPSRPRGGSGRAHTQGFLELEEWNTDLQHPQSARVFDEMYRTDPDCFRSLRMVVNPIIAGTWTVEPYGGKDADEKALRHAEFLRWAFWECMRPSLTRHLQSAVPLFTRHGFGPYEQIWWDQEWEGQQVLTLRTLDVRLPRTVQEWHQDEFGELTKIVQFLPGQQLRNPHGDPQGGLKPIEARDLVYYRVGEEGDNWEGVSLLRPAYKPWYMKDRLERLDVIGHEREATGIPVVYPPQGARNDEGILDAMEEKLSQVRGGEIGYLIMPGPNAQHTKDGQGWFFELVGFGGSQGGRDAKPALEYHSDKIAAAVIAEFMRLGQGGSPGGSRAVGDVQQDPFYAAVEALASVPEEQLNLLGARLVALNFDDAEGPPTFSMEKADSTSMVELGQFVASLIEKGALIPDEPLEDFLRDYADLPPADPVAREAARQQKQLALEQAQLMNEQGKVGLDKEKADPDPEERGLDLDHKRVDLEHKKLGLEQSKKADGREERKLALDEDERKKKGRARLQTADQLFAELCVAGDWHLPPNIRHLSKLLERHGHDQSSAIAIAVASAKRFCAKGEGDRDWCGDVALWEAQKAQADDQGLLVQLAEAGNPYHDKGGQFTSKPKADPDDPELRGGKYTPGSGLDSSLTPPIENWVDPPPPQGKPGQRKGGGFSATGQTNTAIGDMVEKLVEELGLVSLLPPGKRQNPLDVRYRDSEYAFEVKTCTVEAREYKIKPKKKEVASKKRYAKQHGLKAGVMLVVLDQEGGKAYAYWREGIGAYRLTAAGWHFMGEVEAGKAA